MGVFWATAHVQLNETIFTVPIIQIEKRLPIIQKIIPEYLAQAYWEVMRLVKAIANLRKILMAKTQVNWKLIAEYHDACTKTFSVSYLFAAMCDIREMSNLYIYTWTFFMPRGVAAQGIR